MKIAAMLRVKNEARWISEVIESIKPLTENILVFDDHSTDGTPGLAVTAGATVMHSPFEGLNETRDKNFLLACIRTNSPEYVLSIDGDEILESGTAERIRESLRPNTCCYTMPILYLWNDRQHFRVDGVYGRFARSSMFSLIDQGELTFRSGTQGANFHCGNVPANLRGYGGTLPAKILHLGYMLPEDRLRKYEWYNLKDPNNLSEDRYRHMVIGDVFDPDSKFMHGGPLRIWSIADGRLPCGPVR